MTARLGKATTGDFGAFASILSQPKPSSAKPAKSATAAKKVKRTTATFSKSRKMSSPCGSVTRSTVENLASTEYFKSKKLANGRSNLAQVLNKHLLPQPNERPQLFGIEPGLNLTTSHLHLGSNNDEGEQTEGFIEDSNCYMGLSNQFAIKNNDNLRVAAGIKKKPV